MTASSRRSLIWLCIVVAALLGVGAQLHALSHALKAIHSSTHDEPLTAQTLACDLCLHFAATDGLAPMAALALPALPAGQPMAPVTTATRPHAFAFAAYESRAPPILG